MSYDEIISRVADTNGYDKTLVDKVYKAYWKAIREHIIALPLKEDLTDEEFQGLRCNVNIPSIGKLYITLDRYKALVEKYKRIERQKIEKDAAH